MKILIAVLTSLLITLGAPVMTRNCSGNAFLAIDQVTSPGALTLAYSKLLNTANKPCVPPTIIKRTLQLHKWQDASGVWHYSDDTNNNQASDSSAVVIEQNLYSNEEPEPPIVKTWLPFALTGLFLGLCSILYLLMLGVEMALQFFREEETELESATHYERQTAGEALEFFSKTPYEILGITAKASLEEVEAAYERQLSYYHRLNSSKKAQSQTPPDYHRKLISLHQAFEAIQRKKQDKFIATTD